MIYTYIFFVFILIKNIIKFYKKKKVYLNMITNYNEISIL